MPPDGEIYVEFRRQGNAMRVTAIDAVSGSEAYVTGPLNAAQADLQKLAVAKLMRQMGLEGRRHDASDQNKTPPGQGRGIIV